MLVFTSMTVKIQIQSFPKNRELINVLTESVQCNCRMDAAFIY